MNFYYQILKKKRDLIEKELMEIERERETVFVGSGVKR